jgi:hypothetical protein
MMQGLFGRRSAVIGGIATAVFALGAAGPAMADSSSLLSTVSSVASTTTSTVVGTTSSALATASSLASGVSSSTASAAVAGGASASQCTTPTLTQPFLAWGDSNWYALAPGESFDSFDGTGWTLANGASIQTNTLQDGTTGNVLDLPGGAVAVSPPVCVEASYPTARTMISSTPGSAVAVGVSYLNSGRVELSGLISSSGSGFNPSNPFNVHPGNLSGWQLVQFVFVGIGVNSDDQLYNFYVDPRMSD